MPENSTSVTTPIDVNPAWDSMRIILNEKKAIELSIFHQDYRVEIFEIDADGTYIPSLNYYKSGIFITPYN